LIGGTRAATQCWPVAVGAREHPIAHRERGRVLGQVAGQARERAGAAFAASVVDHHRFPVHFADARKVATVVVLIVGLGFQHCGAACELGREAERGKRFEIELQHDRSILRSSCAGRGQPAPHDTGAPMRAVSASVETSAVPRKRR
jgi:hypothetical protein